MNISRTGSSNGLRLELFIGNPDLVQYTIGQLGFYITVNNASFKISFDEGFEIATGTMTSVAVKREFLNRLPDPFNNCLEHLDKIDSFDSELYRSIIKSNRTYRQTDCFDLCFQLRAIKICNCYIISLDSLNATTPCTYQAQLDCTLMEYKKFILSDINDICSSKRPLECNTESLPVTITFSDYPSRAFAENILLKNPILAAYFPNETITYEKIKRSVLALNVYYDELAYTFTSQQPKMQIFDIISNIGGLFGLFIGISFLSFVEILEAFYEVLHILFETKSF